jgi:hypothetical protein
VRILVILATFFAVNGQGGPPIVNSAFENLKDRLIGSWIFVEDEQSYEATFEAVSHGKALLERNSGFIAVYHSDGDSLVMTLYTRDGNQPRFRAPADEQSASSIKFAFLDITNWEPGSEHINGLEIVFKDRDHIVEKWETLQPNGKRSTFAFGLTRKSR